MAEINIATTVISTLRDLGVKRIFGIPGGASMPLDDAATRENNGIVYTLCGDEIDAVFRAQAYGMFARENGHDTLGVAQVTSGPAVLKSLTGIANAYFDSQPVLVLSGNVPRNAPPDAFQGCNVVPAVVEGKFAKRAEYVSDPAQARRLVVEAFRTAVSGRSGSVLLDFPKDVLLSTVDYANDGKLAEQLQLPMQLDAAINRNVVRQIAYVLRRAESPLLIVGQGARRAAPELEQLMNLEQIYAVKTLFADDAVTRDNPFNLGPAGMHGSSYANLAHARSKTRVYLGSSIDDRLMLSSHEGQPNPFKDVTTIHVDIDPRQIGKIMKPTYGVVGDAKDFLRILLEELKQTNEPVNHTIWNQQIKRMRNELPLQDTSGIEILVSEHVIEQIGNAFPDAHVVADVGAHQMRVMQLLGRAKSTSGRLGCMGFGLPASLGIIDAINDYGLPLKPVVLHQGDGGSIMNLHAWYDVARAIAEYGPDRVPLKIVIYADGVLGMVNFWLDEKHAGNTVSSDLTYNGRIRMDFTKMTEVFTPILPNGRTFRIPSQTIHTKSQLSAAKERMYSTPGPYLLQVVVPPAGVTPVIFPGGNTGTQIHTYEHGRPVFLKDVLIQKGL